MNSEEYAHWTEFMRSKRGMWQVDPIHDGLDGRDLMVFAGYTTDPSRGVYVRVHGRRSEAGVYEGAVPHIGEALFTPRWTAYFETVNKAMAATIERLGLPFLTALAGSGCYRVV